MVLEGLSMVLDASGVVLLVWLAYLVMFAHGYSFEGKALAVGAIGLLARLFAPGPQGRIPVALLLFVAVANVSSVVHQWPRFTQWSEWSLLFAPASYLIVMLIFVAGVSHLLRTPRRLSLFMVGLGTAATVLSIQTLFDQSINDFHFQPPMQLLTPSVAQWIGPHDLAVAFSFAIPIALAPAMIVRSSRLLLAGVLLAGVPTIAAVVLGSRGEVVAAMPVVFAMLAIAVVGPQAIQRHRWALIGVGAAAVVVSLAAMVGILSMDLIRNMSGRTGIWRATLQLIGEEPWLGVGPGGYGGALRARDLGQYVIGAGSAHNLVLQIAAETGLAGAALWIALLWTLIRDCWRAAINGTARVLAGAVAFMLVLMIGQWMGETFIEGSFLVERHRVLAWLVFAAAVAVNRTGQKQPLDDAALA